MASSNTDQSGVVSHSWCDGVLSLSGIPNRKWLRPHVEFFISVLLLHLASREGVRYLDTGESWRIGALAVLSLCFVVSFVPRLRWASVCVVLTVLTYKLCNRFPTNANHFFIELLVVAFVVVSYRRPGSTAEDDHARLVAFNQSMRWLLVIFFFWTGIRKLGCGTYFDGAYFAWAISQDARAQFFFEFILPADEYRRAVNTALPGPYRLNSGMALALSNMVWLTEVAVPVMLLIRQLRKAGFWLAVGAIIGIEAYAREFMFGSLFTMMLLFFTDGRIASRLLPVFVLFYGFLLCTAAGILPKFQFN